MAVGFHEVSQHVEVRRACVPRNNHRVWPHNSSKLDSKTLNPVMALAWGWAVGSQLESVSFEVVVIQTCVRRSRSSLHWLPMRGVSIENGIQENFSAYKCNYRNLVNVCHCRLVVELQIQADQALRGHFACLNLFDTLLH